MRRWLACVSFLVPLTVTAAASADCPPGSWFCESVQIGPGGDDAADTPDDDDAAPSNGEVATSPDDVPVKGKRGKRVRVESDGTDRTVEVQGDDAVVVVKKRRGRRILVREGYEERRIPVKKKVRKWRERFGLTLRIEGAAFVPRSHDEVVGMGGAGLSFRWRPSPYFAFDLGGDIVGGNDYNGDERVEFAGSLSGMVYFNPQHRVQVYAIGGVHLAHAEVDTPSTLTRQDYDNNYYEPYSQSRNYFGGQIGLGLEFRIARHFGMFTDALAVIRTRVDSEQPEFRDPYTGEVSNTSAAMLFRAGVNFWW